MEESGVSGQLVGVTLLHRIPTEQFYKVCTKQPVGQGEGVSNVQKWKKSHIACFILKKRSSNTRM